MIRLLRQTLAALAIATGTFRRKWGCLPARWTSAIAQDTSVVSVFDGGRLVFRYRYADVPYKPYADLLFSPAGVQVLRDSPMDHKHHHGLMYALSVDNINFWEESGRELRPAAA